MIKWVGQEDQKGCGLACLAMVTGKTYQEVKADFLCWDNRGISEFDITSYLVDRGFVWQWIHEGCTYKREVKPDGNIGTVMRSDWPPKLWANVHIAQIDVPNGSHFIVVLRDGTVLDPLTPEPRRFETYGRVFNMAA